MSEDEDSTFVVSLPILTISGAGGLELERGAKLRAGGHFYATDSQPFVRNEHPVTYVFVQVESDATLEAPLAIGPGPSVASVSARINKGGVGIFAFVHPMYRTTDTGGDGYYLPTNKHIQAGGTYPASNDDPDAPGVSVKIELIPGGIKGRLTSPMEVIADEKRHSGDAFIESTA